MTGRGVRVAGIGGALGKSMQIAAAAKRKHEAGELPEAERLYRQALAAEPTSAGVARALGGLLIDAKRFADAAEVLGAAASRPTADAETRALLGRCLVAMGRINEAASALTAALAQDASSLTARTWLAKCRSLSHRPEEAIALLTPMLGRHPRDATLRAVLGQALMILGKHDEAIRRLEEVVALRPDAAGYTDLAGACRTCGRLDEAERHYARALELGPGNVIALAGRADVLISVRRVEEATAQLEGALDRGPANAAVAVTYARVAKSPEQRARAIGACARALAEAAPSPGHRSSVRFALGGLREAEGDFDGAFAEFRAANEEYPRAFNAALYERAMDEILSVFHAAALPALPRATNRDQLPVFIVGMPRSGTSLAEQIIASHPRAFGAGELGDMHAIAASLGERAAAGKPPPPERRYPGCVRTLTPEVLERHAGAQLERLRRLGGSAARVTDKMPHNFMHLGLIDLLFPGARVIHCTRDPRDTLLSCYTTPFNQMHSYSNSLADLAAAYRVNVKMMRHLTPIVRVPVLEFPYERVVADPGPWARTLIEFTGLGWDERCLRFHEHARVVPTASIDQVRRPVYNSSVGRWKRFERHLGELIAGLDGLI
ncbi:MAG: sulfotransferase [Phycisphaerae bacterium]|nr:sulfotransferase [Phycisphaerae bacterium]